MFEAPADDSWQGGSDDHVSRGQAGSPLPHHPDRERAGGGGEVQAGAPPADGQRHTPEAKRAFDTLMADARRARIDQGRRRRPFLRLQCRGSSNDGHRPQKCSARQRCGKRAVHPAIVGLAARICAGAGGRARRSIGGVAAARAWPVVRITRHADDNPAVPAVAARVGRRIPK